MNNSDLILSNQLYINVYVLKQQQQQQALLCYDENEGSACGTTSSLPISNVKCEQASPQHSDNCSLSTRSEDSLSLNNCYAFNAQQQQSTFSDAAQMDIYRDLILRHLIQDISTTCAKLALPTDPYVWTAEHSARWISEMCMQFQLHAPRALFLSGRVLLAMNQEEFMARAPDGGDTLHAQLQLWKTGYIYSFVFCTTSFCRLHYLRNSFQHSNRTPNNKTAV
ncbi:unnamed protein product [Anisakis simplex]|uniref:DNA-binding protein D-ETS-4 (inferred by orthology to a D. melanogaster protein) n=1 Tax=Anisakis simplex TaxID=6269 RepID=A0A0M3JW87_ANISI|nr:unnamed protein product [Anisakis simplex]